MLAMLRMLPVKVEAEATIILRALPDVNDVAEIEAMEPTVLDERIANEPDEIEPVNVSLRKKRPFGAVMFPKPNLPLPVTVNKSTPVVVLASIISPV